MIKLLEQYVIQVKQYAYNIVNFYLKMDGLYLDRKNEFIKNWLEKTVSEAKWENFPDLHVDEIDSEFKN